MGGNRFKQKHQSRVTARYDRWRNRYYRPGDLFHRRIPEFGRVSVRRPNSVPLNVPGGECIHSLNGKPATV